MLVRQKQTLDHKLESLLEAQVTYSEGFHARYPEAYTQEMHQGLVRTCDAMRRLPPCGNCAFPGHTASNCWINVQGPAVSKTLFGPSKTAPWPHWVACKRLYDTELSSKAKMK